MQFAVSYQPEYEYDPFIHRRKMIAVYQTQIYIFKLYFIGKELVMSTQNTQDGTCNGSNLTNNSHIWSFSKALNGNGFETVIISRGFLGFQFTLGSSFYPLNIFSYGHYCHKGFLTSCPVELWWVQSMSEKNVLIRSYFCMGRKSF